MRNTAAIRTLLVIWAFVVSQATEVKDGPKAAAFSCRGRSPGYYADLETDCQDYHMCDAGGRRYTYSCPNQTRFQQRVMICDHWFMVNCSLSETHFGANLLIGQKNRQFVEHFQQGSGHNEERSYPSRSRSFYAGTSSSASSEDERSRQQGANEIKQTHLAKHSSAQSSTKTLPEEKDSKTSDINRYHSQFSTPTGSIKATTERSLAREFTNNPFFRSLTKAPASLADKGDRGSVTFLGPRDVTSTSGTPRTPAPPLPARRNATSSFSTPPIREATPSFRNTPSFPNYQQSRTSTLVTTAVPFTYDYNFVTPEGHSNHLTETKTPKLQNNFSKVIPNYVGFTSKPSPSTQYESLKTRVTSAPHDLGVTVDAAQGGRPQPTPHDSGQYRPSVTQGAAGLQRTSGGFRFSTQVSDGRPSSFSPLIPIYPGKTVSSSGTFTTGNGTVLTGSGSVTTGSGSGRTGSGSVPYSSGAVRTGNGTVPTGSGSVPTVSGSGPTGSGSIPYSSGAVRTGSGTVPTGSGSVPTGSGTVSTSGGSVPYRFGDSGSGPSGSDSVPSGGDVFPSSLDPSAAGEDEEDFNTVEVRIADPRRMFFIPDSAAREAEMLSSNNETVFKISLPASRPHGAMRFKGTRGAEGRRADCPQCHPAFLLPGKCVPCVLIRR